MKSSLFHVVEAQQFDRPDLDEVFSIAGEMQRLDEQGQLPTNDLAGKVISTFFCEPSTRTRSSFERAVYNLGGHVIPTDNASIFSSLAKGETIEDTVRVMGEYADAIVMRSKEEGYAKRAAAVSSVPIINAGDGTGQHPTQALLDLFTMQSILGRIDGLKVALVGDLKYGRTVHSLAYLLGKYQGVTVKFVAPPQVQIPDNILKYCKDHGMNTIVTDDLRSALSDADVAYMTRIQRERMPPNEYDLVKGTFILTPELVETMKENGIILHPLPRVDEIPVSVDSNQRAKYFKPQIKNGVYIRMALLKQRLGK